MNKPTAAPSSAAPGSTSNRLNFGKLLSPKNLQDTLKSVGNLRGTVKNWLQYLQQADQLLDTLYVASNSLKETGVLDKLVKHKGRNLNTEDFTNILMALMNTPVGAQLFKGGREDNANTES
ncbi:hypothetical protein [Alicyclobacillus contaminans]|uniref:hypothetical protein n=1 Tax=Alicyclobacillus contaminans TaxID=392016 RepID=UPI0003FB2E69|nr:hypothetical protein [Alicyclobacillus contaminans]